MSCVHVSSAVIDAADVLSRNNIIEFCFPSYSFCPISPGITPGVGVDRLAHSLVEREWLDLIEALCIREKALPGLLPKISLAATAIV